MNFEFARCKMSSLLFLEANKRGYDSVKFADKLMTSEYARYLYSDEALEMWLGHNYVLETAEWELGPFEKGKVLPDEFMEWAGYLYRYWSLIRPENGNEIYAKAPLSLLLEGYTGWHCMDFKSVVDELSQE